MSVNVVCDASCDAHVTQSRGAVSAYLNTRGNNVNPSTRDVFDQAVLVGTGHYSTSAWDPTPSDHITVRMSNPTLRSQGMFQVLHWRPSGPNRWAPSLTSAAQQQQRANARRAKKQRARANAAARQGGTQPGSSSTAAPSASSSGTQRPAAAPAPGAPRPAASSLAFVPRTVAKKAAPPAKKK